VRHRFDGCTGILSARYPELAELGPFRAGHLEVHDPGRFGEVRRKLLLACLKWSELT
jgi:hypothetical protein